MIAIDIGITDENDETKIRNNGAKLDYYLVILAAIKLSYFVSLYIIDNNMSWLITASHLLVLYGLFTLLIKGKNKIFIHHMEQC